MIATAVRLWLVSVLAIGTLPAWAATDEQNLHVRDLVKLSGLQHEIRQFPQQILAGFDQQRRTLPAEQHAALRQALASSFDASTLERQITQELESSLRPEVVTDTLKWLRSDLGRKVTMLEVAASNPKAQQELRAFAKQLEKSPPAAERLQLIRRIDWASNGTESVLDMSEAVALSIASAYEATLPASQRTGMEEIRLQLSRQREMLRRQVQGHVWLSMLHSYQTLPQDELQQYVEFLESEVGSGFYAQANTAFKEAFKMSIPRVGRTMMNILKPPAGRKSV